jgi:hypothetical protein
VSAVIALAATSGVASAQGTITKAPFRFTVDARGVISNLETPVGTSQGLAAWSGYALCLPNGPGYSEADVVPFAIKQPNGVNTLPLSVIVRDPTDQWEITWTYTVDPKENELLTTAKVKRLSGGTAAAILRMGFLLDPNGEFNSYADHAVLRKAVWQRTAAVGFTYWGITNGFGGSATATIPQDVFNNPSCVLTPFADLPAFGDANPNITYILGNIGNGKSKTVAFQLRRY